MANNCYNMVVTVMLLVGTEKVRATKNPCDDCQPGTYCDKYNPVCKSCPESTYSSTGGQPNCNICRVCQGYFTFKKHCSSTHNAECECTEGFHCLGPQCTRCEKDCRPGQELTEQGCKTCGLGTFNDQNGTGICRPWTNCSLAGRSVLKNGTKEKDVVCGPPVVSVYPVTTTTATTEGAPSFKKAIGAAQEEDACSCRFPEEEEGGGGGGYQL
uniref:tumor necrosis factor receptor superfamily member 9 isoform X2 n=1 Tax=Arvicanthis niloticus TaxID=61156 RepID=UPI0014865CCF|nr:tumor necrosis factor receptor superfamily member 9 isoform X2 [Arvicanthis niloticus]